MPFPNEHSCRLRNPDDFQDDSFRRTSRRSDGKEYDIIMGRLSGETTMTEQAYRYDKDTWTASEARSHCREHDGSFEVASGEKTMTEIIERKVISGGLKAGEEGAFTARIATLNVLDKDKDVLFPGAVPPNRLVLVSAYQHGAWQGRLPVGKANLREAGEEILAEGKFFLTTPDGKAHYETIKAAGDLVEWSYGFIATKSEMGEWEGQNARFLKAVDVIEVSPVLRGAGLNTGTLSIKTDSESYLTQAEAVLAAVSDLEVRTRSLAGLRRKEGRGISLANRKRLADFLSALSGVAGNLRELLEIADADSQKQLMGAFLEYSRIKTKLTEVMS